MIETWPLIAALLIVGIVCLIATRQEKRRIHQCQQITQQVRDMRITLFTGGRK